MGGDCSMASRRTGYGAALVDVGETGEYAAFDLSIVSVLELRRNGETLFGGVRTMVRFQGIRL